LEPLLGSVGVIGTGASDWVWLAVILWDMIFLQQEGKDRNGHRKPGAGEREQTAFFWKNFFWKNQKPLGIRVSGFGGACSYDRGKASGPVPPACLSVFRSVSPNLLGPEVGRFFLGRVPIVFFGRGPDYFRFFPLPDYLRLLGTRFCRGGARFGRGFRSCFSRPDQGREVGSRFGV